MRCSVRPELSGAIQYPNEIGAITASRLRWLLGQHVDLQEMVDEHRGLLAAIRAGDGQEAARLAVGHLRTSRDAARARLVQAVEQARMGAARPRPLPQLLQAAFVDGDDGQAFVGRILPVADQLVVDAFVLLPE